MIELALAGALASVASEVIKRYFGTKGNQTLAVVAVVSLVAAVVYTTLVAYGYWEATVSILVVALAVHNAIIRRI